MVVFRVDANSMIGKGHMKRCVSIAKAIRLLGGSVLFVTREDSDTSLIEGNFMEYETVPSMTLGSEKAINCLKDIISEKNAKVCVVDSYDVSNTAFNSLKEVCKVILIEDYLYEVYDEVRLGELTFSPRNSFTRCKNRKHEIELGKYLKLF